MGVDMAVQLRSAALELLGRREHSVRELAGKLARRYQIPSLSPELLECLQRLADDGYQSDQRFAEVFVRSRRARGYGPAFIEQELRQRGIAADLVVAAVDREDDSWKALATEHKRKKFGAGAITALTEKAKVVRFLRYRGFLQNQIDHALGDRCAI
ncbi:MAG TPA: regulatory protein RecX [Pseudomonadales bacterium]|nr:regulatory protein RecX [Pseudomonadales bacterium]